jgi:hypothetical protein
MKGAGAMNPSAIDSTNPKNADLSGKQWKPLPGKAEFRNLRSGYTE